MMAEHKHLTHDILLNFNQEKLNEEDYMNVLEHISCCNDCAQMFADCFTATDTLTPPHYLKENIMEEIHHTEETQRLLSSQLQPKLSLRKQLFFYSLKVSAAMLGALVITFSGLPSRNFSGQKSDFPIMSMSKMSDFTKSLNEFSTKLINLEVNYYDEEEK